MRIRHSQNMHAVICSDFDYHSKSFQKFTDDERSSKASSWIFDLIDNKHRQDKERIFINRDAWCLCADKHFGTDSRYLIIFKDKSLKTLRDLRCSHLDLLREISTTVQTWISQHHSQRFFTFFHYMPSVFQLHIHVNSCSQYINRFRAHFVSTVMRNIRRDSEHYAHALILTKFCKTIKRAETHDTVKLAI